MVRTPTHVCLRSRRKQNAPHTRPSHSLLRLDCCRFSPFSLFFHTTAAFGALPPLETQAYRVAVQRVPHLVQTETPFGAYLQATQGDAVAAARRVAKFWKFRLELFGTAKWLLPMVQTGAGALTSMEIAFIQSGFVMLIERPLPQGLLIVVDFSRAMQVFTRARAMQLDTLSMIERVGMYFGVVFAHEFPKGPLALLHPITSRKRPEMEIRHRFWDMLQTSYPGHLAQVVVAQTCETGK